MPETSIAEILFELPTLRLSRDERIRVIKEVLAGDEEITQERLDQVMERLLAEIQSDP